MQKTMQPDGSIDLVCNTLAEADLLSTFLNKEAVPYLLGVGANNTRVYGINRQYVGLFSKSLLEWHQLLTHFVIKAFEDSGPRRYGE